MFYVGPRDAQQSQSKHTQRTIKAKMMSYIRSYIYIINTADSSRKQKLHVFKYLYIYKNINGYHKIGKSKTVTILV